MGLAPYLNLPKYRFAFPCAPLSLGPRMGNGRAWWMIDMAKVEAAMASGSFRDMSQEEPAGMASVRETMTLSLQSLCLQLGVESFVLGGFSQGAMLSTELTLESDLRIDKLVILSGTMLATARWTQQAAALESIPIFQSHGRSDMILGFKFAEMLKDCLNLSGKEVTWVPFAGGHEIPRNVLDELREFLQS